MAESIKFSLITVTMGRDADLARLNASLAVQTYTNFEHIIVDHREHPEFQSGLSRARNFGLDQARGEIIAFADDDIVYPPDLLARIAEELADPALDGISYRVTDADGVCSAGWMEPGRVEVSKRNVWRTIVSVSFFVKRTKVGDVRFDERLGVGSGTRFGSGEETDFALNLLKRGLKIRYDGSHAVIHPQFSGTYTTRRGWLYGNGWGCVVRRQGYSPVRLFVGVGVQGARAVQSLLMGRFAKMRFHVVMAVGRIAGWLFPL